MSCGASCELRCSVGDGSCTPCPAARRAVRRRADGPRARVRSLPLARRRPTSDAGPALPLASTAPGRSSGKPARIRAVSLKVHSGAPRVGSTGRARAQVVDEALGARRGLVVEELPVDHHDRREVAGRVALDVLQGDLAVVGGLAVADAQVLLELLEDRVAAHHRAQGVGADAHLVVTARPAPVHGVEGGDRGDLGRGQVQHVRAEPHPGARDMALLRLHEMQQRQERGPGVRVAGDDLARVRLEPGSNVVRVGGRGQFGHAQADAPLGRSGGHRSTPPITGSMDATATMTSATWPPSHIAAMA